MVSRSPFRVLFVVIGFSALAAFAQDEKDSKDSKLNPIVAARLKLFDKNNDGKISKEELPERLQRVFDRMDQNGDGVLDTKEIGRTLNRERPTRGAMSDERLVASAPEGIIIEPSIAYREGDSKAWRLDLIRPKVESETDLISSRLVLFGYLIVLVMQTMVFLVLWRPMKLSKSLRSDPGPNQSQLKRPLGRPFGT